MFPMLQCHVFYGICAFVLRCFFFCSQTVLQMEHSLGVKNFFSSSLSSCKKLYFLNTLSPVLSTPLSYVCCVCMDRLMANFAGTCTSDNKGLLLLLLLLLLLPSQDSTVSALSQSLPVCWAGITGRCHACCAIPPHPGIQAPFFSSSSVPRMVNPGEILQAPPAVRLGGAV